jgi:murein DD-endopeptidase MepM/ murein hydrolase activator NlpD
LSLFKILATLGTLLTNTPAQSELEKLPVVGVPLACGTEYEISQAHDTGTHKHNDKWAWDFRMPEGVAIVAAKDGVVRMARGDSTRGGCDPKFARDANYVVVDHGEGYETQYLHFSSVVVEPGQKVSAGELLGYSGNTGWSCGSHLHFKLAKRVHNGWNNPSVRARIEGYGDPQARVLVSAPACPTSAPEIIQASAGGDDLLTPEGTAAGGGQPSNPALVDEHADPTVAPAGLSQ